MLLPKAGQAVKLMGSFGTWKLLSTLFWLPRNQRGPCLHVTLIKICCSGMWFCHGLHLCQMRSNSQRTVSFHLCSLSNPWSCSLSHNMCVYPQGCRSAPNKGGTFLTTPVIVTAPLSKWTTAFGRGKKSRPFCRKTILSTIKLTVKVSFKGWWGPLTEESETLDSFCSSTNLYIKYLGLILKLN